VNQIAAWTTSQVKSTSVTLSSHQLWDHPAYYPIGTGSSFPGSKASGALS